MNFLNIEFLFLFLPLIALWLLIKNKKTSINRLFSKEVLAKISVNNYGLSLTLRLKLILIASVFIILSLTRPQILTGEIKVSKNTSDIIVAFDMSKSMLANDIFPNRFDFAKNKFLSTLKKITTNTRIAILGFSNQSFLISPLTSDFFTLEFLIKNLDLDNLNLKGTDFLGILQSVNDLFDTKKHKSVLILTDGGDNASFTEVISYANDNNIKIFIYDISTTKGGIIKDNQDILKDKNGNIVVVKTNENIKELALQTYGKYLKYSLINDDLKNLITIVSDDQTTSKITTRIKKAKELFYYPLSIAFILLIIAFFSLPRKR